MTTLEDYMKFIKIANTMRNGSQQEVNQLRNNPETVRFVASMAEKGLVDSWLKAYDEITREGV